MFAVRLTRSARAVSYRLASAAILLAATAHFAGPAGAADLYGGYGAAPMMHGTPCGEWPSNLAGDGRNLPYENFGCASANNLAAMLENPNDLYGPRPSTPRDAERRDTIFDFYRSGENPSGQYATDSAGTASDVGN